jgi:hypothetical protein
LIFDGISSNSASKMEPSILFIVHLRFPSNAINKTCTGP